MQEQQPEKYNGKKKNKTYFQKENFVLCRIYLKKIRKTSTQNTLISGR